MQPASSTRPSKYAMNGPLAADDVWSAVFSCAVIALVPNSMPSRTVNTPPPTRVQNSPTSQKVSVRVPPHLKLRSCASLWIEIATQSAGARACRAQSRQNSGWCGWLQRGWLAVGTAARQRRAGLGTARACRAQSRQNSGWCGWLQRGWLAGHGWAWLTDVAWLAEWLWVKPWCVEVSVMHLQWRGELSAEVSGWHRLPGNRKKPVLFSHRGYTGQDFLGELSSLLTVNLSCFFC